MYRLRADAPKLGCAPLNAGELFVGDACDAKTVIEDVRRRVSALYDDFLSDDGRVFDYRGAAESAAFKAFVDATHELQRVHLNGMNRDQRTAFFINLYNALVIHGTCASLRAEDDARTLGFLLQDVVRRRGIDARAMTSRTASCAATDQVPPRSARFSINRGSRGGPFARVTREEITCARRQMLACTLPWCAAHVRAPPRVYSSETLDAELEDAAFSFLNPNSTSRYDDGEVQSCAVSKIVGEWYKRDFGADDPARLRYVARYAKPDDARDALIRALDRGDAIALTTRPYDWTLNDGR